MAETDGHAVERTVGPFGGAVRPFTVNGAQSLVFVNVDGLLGFEVGDLQSGQRLHRVEVEGVPRSQPDRHGCPSHGIGLPPNERELWLCDGFNHRLHVFAEDGSATLNDYVSSYDGVSSRSMTRPQGGGGKAGSGSIRNERRNTDAPSQPLVPLRLHLRPLAEGFSSFKPERMKVAGAEQVGGRRCLVVADSGKLGDLGYRVWVDPGREYTVRKWESFLSDGTVLLRADISYAPSASLGWVPDRWEVSVLDRSGKVIRTYSGELSEYEIGLKLTREDFRLEFPPGTRVYDSPRQEEFIVGKDGSRLPVRQPPR